MPRHIACRRRRSTAARSHSLASVSCKRSTVTLGGCSTRRESQALGTAEVEAGCTITGFDPDSVAESEAHHFSATRSRFDGLAQ